MNIYVSNLQSFFNDEDLYDLFATFGSITTSKVIMDRFSGQSRGFGFVEMSSETEGKAAIDGLNGKVIEGRAIGVSIAKEREARPNNNGYRY